MRQFDLPILRAMAPVNEPFSWPNNCFREGPEEWLRIHFYKTPDPCESSGCELRERITSLPVPVSPWTENRRVRRRNNSNALEHSLSVSTISNDFFEVVAQAGFRLQVKLLLCQPLLASVICPYVQSVL